MDAFRFDHFTRALTTAPSRRVVVQGLVATVLGSAPVRPPSAVHARKRRSKLQLNEFGCVDVGGKCRGQDRTCCSGICQGKKPKKSKKDKSRCVAHYTGGCQAESGQGTFVPCPADMQKSCFRTTGNGFYCGEAPVCQNCTKDDDCRAFCHDEAAACIVRDCGGFGPTACVAPDGCMP